MQVGTGTNDVTNVSNHYPNWVRVVQFCFPFRLSLKCFRSAVTKDRHDIWIIIIKYRSSTFIELGVAQMV